MICLEKKKEKIILFQIFLNYFLFFPYPSPTSHSSFWFHFHLLHYHFVFFLPLSLNLILVITKCFIYFYFYFFCGDLPKSWTFLNIYFYLFNKCLVFLWVLTFFVLSFFSLTNSIYLFLPFLVRFWMENLFFPCTFQFPLITWVCCFWTDPYTHSHPQWPEPYGIFPPQTRRGPLRSFVD